MTEISSNSIGKHSKPVIPRISSSFVSHYGRIQTKAVLPVASNTQPSKQLTLQLSDIKECGKGSFGSVYSCKADTGELLAIKRTFQDQNYKNRELEIMLQLNHQNIVTLKYIFFDKQDAKLYLNLVLGYMPKTLSCLVDDINETEQKMPTIYVRLYAYQMFRAIAYLHSKGFCHRDIKPSNILVDPETAVLKLCDFGSAKVLAPGEASVAYIGSRYYRAPESIFGSVNYTNAIDVWAVGAVLVEIVIGKPIFPGKTSDDQLVRIIKVIGAPTEEQVRVMNPDYKYAKYHFGKRCSWPAILGDDAPSELSDLVGKLLIYEPQDRLSPLRSCAHPFFDELRNPTTRLPDDRPLPLIFEYSDCELQIDPPLNNILFPKSVDSDFL